jgi:hypothetical protein
MKSKSSAVAAVTGSLCAIAILASPAHAVKPDLCETSCGGAWGAREHARAYAEREGFTGVAVSGCARSDEYYSEWHCQGTGSDGKFHSWDAWINSRGYLELFEYSA